MVERVLLDQKIHQCKHQVWGSNPQFSILSKENMKKKTAKKQQPQIKVLKITPVKCENVDFDMNDAAKEALLSYAKEHILSDEKALLTWSVEQAILNSIECMEKSR